MCNPDDFLEKEKDDTMYNSNQLNEFNNDSHILDQILDNYGYKWYVIKDFLLYGIITYIDCLTSNYFGLMIIPIQKHFRLSSYETQLTSSMFHLGGCFGSFLTGSLCTYLGRSFCVKYSILLTFIFQMSLGFVSSNFIMFAILRFLTGFFACLNTTVMYNWSVESFPSRLRCFVCLTAWSIGYLLLCSDIGIMLIFMPNLQASKLNLTFFLQSLKLFVIFIIFLFTFNDSARHLLYINEDEKAFQILENYYGNKLHSEVRKIIKKESCEINNDSNSNLCGIFKKKFLKLTLLTTIIIFNVYFLFLGMNLVLSLTLTKISQKNNEETNYKIIIDQLLNLIFIVISQIITGIMSEIKLIGRKWTMNISCFISSISLVIGCTTNNFVPFFLISNFFISNIYSLINVYTPECYPTMLRDQSTSFSNGISRIGNLLSQFVYIILEDMGAYVPYYFSATICGLTCIAMYFLPYESHEKSLDTKDYFEIKEDTDHNE